MSEIVRNGPGIAEFEDVLAGRYQSPSGMGMGIGGARRLMDRFSLDTSSRGTTVDLVKYPSRAPLLTEPRVKDIATALATPSRDEHGRPGALPRSRPEWRNRPRRSRFAMKERDDTQWHMPVIR